MEEGGYASTSAKEIKATAKEVDPELVCYDETSLVMKKKLPTNTRASMFQSELRGRS